MFFGRTSTQPPNMHQKLTKNERFYKQNNQLPTKSHDELEDNSISPQATLICPIRLASLPMQMTLAKIKSQQLILCL